MIEITETETQQKEGSNYDKSNTDSTVKKSMITKYAEQRLNERLDSQSKRIRDLQEKLSQIISNNKYYAKHRLPDVLKREKAKVSFSTELNKARVILKSLGKNRFMFASNSKDPKKREERYIGMFTHLEMTKLRRFLESDLSLMYTLYRAKQYKHLKDKQLLFITTEEAVKLHNFLKSKSSISKDIPIDSSIALVEIEQEKNTLTKENDVL